MNRQGRFLSLSEEVNDYWIENPVFLKFKKRFELSLMRLVREKKVCVNERIIEIPFVIRALSGLTDGSCILDLGCSGSPLPLYLSALGLRVTGLDFRRFPYTFANFEFVQGDILEMPFDDAFFDAVTCISTLEHLGLGYYQDPKSDRPADERAMQEIGRVLKSGGRLVLSVPYGIPGQNEHQRIYNEARLTELLAGWRIERKQYYVKVFPDGAWNNFWAKVSAEKAGRVDAAGKTEAVCCIEAVRS